jgi:hypothetical protein
MRKYDYRVAPGITPGATSYFSSPANELDPKLFTGLQLNPSIREGVLSILFEYLAKNFNEPHRWVKAWLAGSGVSYQWYAARQPGDLDCLVGIEYVKFRQDNLKYTGFSNNEIASMFNEGFNYDVIPNTRNWNGYELTYYVNPSTDIRDINPYSAYDLISDTWTVEPDRTPNPPYNRDWEQKSQRDHDMAVDIINRHNLAVNELRGASNTPYQVNAERKIHLAQDQAAALFDEIHHGRKLAFSQIGSGYADYHNYRWQFGKKSGAIQGLRTLKDQRDSRINQENNELYGVELPTASTLIRRSLRG